MYMNPDGTVDRIPGWTNEREEAGLYVFRKNTLTVKLEDGSEKVYLLNADGAFVTPDPLVNEMLVFTRDEKE